MMMKKRVGIRTRQITETSNERKINETQQTELFEELGSGWRACSAKHLDPAIPRGMGCNTDQR